VSIPAEGLALRELASKLSLRVNDLKSKLEDLGEDLESLMANSNSSATAGGRSNSSSSSDEQSIGDIILDADVAELVVLEMGLTAKRLAPVEDLAVQVSL
jgi:hypothetical protein